MCHCEVSSSSNTDSLGTPAHRAKVAAANVLQNDKLGGLYDVQAICKPLLSQDIQPCHRILKLQ